MKVLCALLFVLLFASTVLGADLIVSNGVLVGAQHVSIGESLYALAFVDGSCNSLFNGCGPNQFAFRDSASAMLASQAIRDQVWVGPYATNPTLTHGCESGPGVCLVYTPYDMGFGLFKYVSINNDPPFFSFATRDEGVSYDTGANTTAARLRVFAVWSPEVAGSGPLSNPPTPPPLMDFDGNGYADILLRDPIGNVSIWLMNASGQMMDVEFGRISLDIKIAGTGDFNNDGRSDILWRGANGDISIWFMEGAVIGGGMSLGNVPPDWVIVGVRDFDGNGKPDILWQNDSGMVAVWWLDKGTIVNSYVAGMAPGRKAQ